MEEQELRAWLAGKLKKSVPDALWDYLKEREFVRDALEVGESGRRDLLKAARDEFALTRALANERTRPPATARRERIQPDLGSAVHARARAREEALATAAAREPRVRRFRRRFLKGHHLSVPEARRLLASPAAALVEELWFERTGVPVVGHRSKEIGRRNEVVDATMFRVVVDLQIETPDGPRDERTSWTFLPEQLEVRRVLAFVDETGERQEIEVRQHSVLDYLRDLAEWLKTWYGWPSEQAAWFVLTNAPPRRGALRISYQVLHAPSHLEAQVTMEIEPWVPAELVQRAYRDVQRELLGKENRSLSERNLAALRFVLTREQEEDVKPEAQRQRLTWKHLVEAWNAAHPEAAYAEERNFARDVGRARRAVLFPKYRSGRPDSKEE